MSARKRSSKEFLDDKPRLRIVLAAQDQQARHAEPLAPYCQIVQLFSQCAAGLPAKQAEDDTAWDLGNVLIDGQPVARATVVAWLNACYQ
jgi:hypothetical protein